MSTRRGAAGPRFDSEPVDPEILQVDTEHGPARLLIDRPRRSGRAATPRAVLALGHGAGGGPEAIDLRALATGLPARGIEVVRVEQPWRLAGKRIAPRPAVLDEAWTGALSALPALSGSGTGARSRRRPGLIVGGRSAGARVACRTARAVGAVGCLALAFPLHPPGQADDPSKDRSPELVGADLPTLVLQGERDPFGGPAEVRDRAGVRAAPSGSRAASSTRAATSTSAGRAVTEAGRTGGPIEVVPVPSAGHELTVPKRATITQSEVLELIVDRAAEWIEGLVDGK